MRKHLIVAAACMLGCLESAAQQLPRPPAPGPFQLPPPDIPHKGNPGSQPACTKEYATQLKTQIAELEQLRGAGVERVQQLCDGIALAEKGVEIAARAFGMNPDDAKRQLESWVEGQIEKFNPPPGFPKITFGFAKNTCYRAEGEMGRYLITELGRLQGEVRRCGDV